MVGLSWDAKVGSSLAKFGFVDTLSHGYGEFEDLLGVLFCNVFDRHATGRAEDESGTTRSAIKGHTQVKFLFDVNLLDEVDGVDGQTVHTALVGHEGLAEKFTGNFLGPFGVIDEVDTALETGFLDVTHATTATKHLRLNDAATFEGAGDFFRLIDTESNVANGDGNLVRVKQGTCLVLVKLQPSHGEGTIFEEGSVEEPVGEHHF